jgi:hypothetical protein
MAYDLSAWIAHHKVFANAGIKFKELSQGFAITTRSCDDLAPKHEIAYVYASFWGGFGEQEAEYYKAGTKVIFGALEPGAINKALKLLGVMRVDGQDEFDSLGLGQERSNDWLDDWQYLPDEDK